MAKIKHLNPKDLGITVWDYIEILEVENHHLHKAIKTKEKELKKYKREEKNSSLNIINSPKM